MLEAGADHLSILLEERGTQIMPSIRQDAWSHEEDEKLAEIILKSIRGGSTQLAGFAEAGELLARTPAACGFRWNATMRKQYEQELQDAKAARKAMKAKRTAQTVEQMADATPYEWKSHEKEAQIDQMIAFLNHLKEGQTGNQERDRLETLSLRNEQLEISNRELKKDYEALKENYASLLHILNLVDRARKQIPFDTSIHSEQKEATSV